MKEIIRESWQKILINELGYDSIGSSATSVNPPIQSAKKEISTQSDIADVPNKNQKQIDDLTHQINVLDQKIIALQKQLNPLTTQKTSLQDKIQKLKTQG